MEKNAVMSKVISIKGISISFERENKMFSRSKLTNQMNSEAKFSLGMHCVKIYYERRLL